MKQALLKRVLALLVLAVAARSTLAIDLNGTWQGTDKCKGFAGGTGLPFPKYPATVEIIQTDTLSAIAPITVRETYSVGSNSMCVLFNGVVTQDSTDPTKGAIALVEPGTTDTLASNNALLTATVTTSKRGSGKLKATLVSTFVGGMKTCKLVYSRADTTVATTTLACP